MAPNIPSHPFATTHVSRGNFYSRWDNGSLVRNARKQFDQGGFRVVDKSHAGPRENVGCTKYNVVAFTGNENTDIKVHKFVDKEFVAIADVNKMFQVLLSEGRQLIEDLLCQQATLHGIIKGLMEEKKCLQDSYEGAMETSRSRYTDLQMALVQAEELQNALGSTEKELERVRKELGRAVLVAAEQIEERLEDTWESENMAEFKALQDELASTKDQLDQLQSSAVEMERDVSFKTVQTVQNAVSGVETRAQAEINISAVAARIASEAAGKSSTAAETALEKQQEALALVKSIQKRAFDAEQAASRSHQESLALTEEVKNLREAVTKAQTKLAEESNRAMQCEKDASERVASIEKEAASRVNAVERAYGILKDAEREKVQNLEQEAGKLRSENQHLASEVEELRSEMSLAEAAVAQAQAQMTAMEAALNKKLELLEEIREAEEDDASKMEAAFAEAAKELKSKELHSQVAGEINCAKVAMGKSMRQFKLRLEALNRATVAATKERDHWKAQARHAQEQEKVAATKLKELVTAMNGNLSGGRVNVILSSSERRRLLGLGPRCDEHTGGETSEIINSGWITPPEKRGSD
ncbi:hypothetical protein BSKO_02221 [Bryopsis sp. KO-2023]|nr:hypothetical protein BSKO_02221 [Bryopsis sp. KO-2023]